MLHELTQLPFEQNSWTPHALPHVPQLALSVLVFVQNGTPPSGAHFVSACEHVLLQLPAWQNSPGWQIFPHAPQFQLSVCVSTHVAGFPQTTSSFDGHVSVHLPATHACGEGHTL